MSEDTPTQQKEPSLQGADRDTTAPDARQKTLEEALDYRGDVTVHTDDGREITGYIFDRNGKAAEPYIRMIPADGDDKVKVLYSAITRIVFSGRDTASGKSWETWVKKYHEKKARGESANIESEPLEDE